MDKTFKLVNIALLGAILGMLAIIDHHIPPPLPTGAEIEASKKDHAKRTAMQGRLQYVGISGSVSVENYLGVPLEVQDTLPLDVQVSNSVEVRSDPRDPLYIQTDPTGGHRLQIDDRKPIEVQIVQGQ